jgi:hypothetical protein
MDVKNAAKMVNNPRFADVLFKMEDAADPIYAHRAYLANSEYFTSMLTSGLKEATQKPNADGQIEIQLPESVSTEVLLCVLEYIYAGVTTRITADTLAPVLALADQYTETGLVDACRLLIRAPTMITCTNWLHVWACLHAPSLQERKNDEEKKVIRLFVETHAVEIVQALQRDSTLLEQFIRETTELGAQTLERISSLLPRHDALVTFWIMDVVVPSVSKRLSPNLDKDCLLVDVFDAMCSTTHVTAEHLDIKLSKWDIDQVIADFETKKTDVATVVHLVQDRTILVTMKAFAADGDVRLFLQANSNEDTCLCSKKDDTLIHAIRGACGWSIDSLGPVAELRKRADTSCHITAQRYRTGELCLDEIAKQFDMLSPSCLLRMKPWDLHTLVRHESLAVATETELLHICVQTFLASPPPAGELSSILDGLRLGYVAPEALFATFASHKELNLSPTWIAEFLSGMLGPSQESHKKVRAGWTKPCPYLGPTAIVEFIIAQQQQLLTRQLQPPPSGGNTRKRQREVEKEGSSEGLSKKLKTDAAPLSHNKEEINTNMAI